MQQFIKNLSFLLSAFLIAGTLYSQDEIKGDGGNGYALFKKNCTACHMIEGELVGPALGGVVERLSEKGLGREWFQKWIKNNQELRNSGDAYALEVYNKYNQQAMLAFPNLTEQNIDDILVYTSDAAGGEAAFKKAEEAAVAAAEAAAAVASGGSSGVSTGIVIIGFGIIAVLLILILFKINTLSNVLADPELQGSKEDSEPFDFVAAFEKYQKPAGAFLGILGFLAFYGFFSTILSIGVDKGYMPEQPIYFSHKIHAGVQKIDCQYCHSSAKYSKSSGIPSVNVCMNCHTNINEYNGEYIEDGKDKGFYTGEIQKIYESIGWDPSARTYSSEQKPIKWVRIHNMPDFVYFNHQQHVVAGEKAILGAIEKKTIPNYDELNIPEDNVQVCYACHGNVSEMNEVYMANTFTMGWCIECHRTTEVDMGNVYNASYYQDLHSKLKVQYGNDVKTTVDAIGGLECGKCHY